MDGFINAQALQGREEGKIVPAPASNFYFSDDNRDHVERLYIAMHTH